MSNNGIENIYKHQIIDKTAHLNVYGLNVTHKDTGLPTFTIDNSGNVSMHSGSITWDSPVIEYQYSADNTNWHSTEAATDKYRREKQVGGNWKAGYQYKGIDGSPGSNGSDANVPGYITATKITQTTIESPTIYGGEIYAGDGNNYAKMESNAFSLYQNGTSEAKASVYVYDSNDGTDTQYAALALGAGSIGVTGDGKTKGRFYIEKKILETDLYLVTENKQKIGLCFSNDGTITPIGDTKLNVTAVFA